LLYRFPEDAWKIIISTVTVGLIMKKTRVSL
jgi:hypothetical protein